MSNSLRSIVTGVASMTESDPHLSAAVRLARSSGAVLHLVHAYRLPEPLLAPHSELLHFGPTEVREIEAQMGRDLEALAAQHADDVETRVHLVHGAGGVSILDVAEEVTADLIVVGATRRGAVARTFLGTTAQRVLRGARVPVLLVREENAAAPRRVLLTTDLSDHSLRVQNRAFSVLQAMETSPDAEMRSVVVIDATVPFPPPRHPNMMREAAEKMLDSYLERAGTGAWAPQGVVRVGEPANEIVREAEEWNADLLVVGTHARRRPARFMIGSVAESVIKKAECGVLVIPLQDRPDDQDSGERRETVPAAGDEGR